MSFKLNVTDLFKLSLDEVKKRVEDASTPLGDIKFLDLAVENPDAEECEDFRGMNHGVYLFFNDDKCMPIKCAYVGKTVNQGFPERIGSHFGARDSSQGNAYLRRTLARKHFREKKGEIRFQDYAEMATKMNNHRLTLINVYGFDSECFRSAGGDPGRFTKVPWATRSFCKYLEMAFQSIYCPDEDRDADTRAGDHFLIKPNRGRKKLRRIKWRMDELVKKSADPNEPNDTFASLIGCVW